MELTVPHFVYLAASDGEEAIWAQMLVVVILAAGGGIYVFIKTRPRSRRGSTGLISACRNIFDRGIEGVSHLIKAAERQIPLNRPVSQQLTAEHSSTPDKSIRGQASSGETAETVKKTLNAEHRTFNVERSMLDVESSNIPVLAVKRSHTGAKRRDLKSGMECLAGSFLVKIIESRQAGILAEDLDIEMQKMCFAEMKRRNKLEAVSSEALKTYTIDEAGHYGKTIRRQAMEELFRRTGRQYP